MRLPEMCEAATRKPKYGEAEGRAERLDNVSLDRQIASIDAQNAVLASGERIVGDDPGEDRTRIFLTDAADLDGNRAEDIEFLEIRDHDIAAHLAEGPGNTDADKEPAGVADAIARYAATISCHIDRHRPRSRVALRQWRTDDGVVGD